jgi:hypothetical protein
LSKEITTAPPASNQSIIIGETTIIKDCGLIDTGARITFAGGGQAEPKVLGGRFDLIPGNVITAIINRHAEFQNTDLYEAYDIILDCEPSAVFTEVLDLVFKYSYYGGIDNLIDAYVIVAAYIENKKIDDIFTEALTKAAIQYEKGAIKYSERNWEKGIPMSHRFNSCVRHILKAYKGMNDEDHYAALIWNLYALIYYELCMPETHDLFCHIRGGTK